MYQYLLIGPQKPQSCKYERQTDTERTNERKSREDKETRAPRRTLRGVAADKPESVRTHVPKPCAQPLTDPLPKVGRGSV
jgi:hypothetical protein